MREEKRGGELHRRRSLVSVIPIAEATSVSTVTENLGWTTVELTNEELGEPNQFAESMEAKSGRYNERPKRNISLGHCAASVH